MDKQDWAPEPIRAEAHTYLSGMKGYLIIGADNKEFMYTEELTPTIERLLVCYNACAGMPTESLLTLHEPGAVVTIRQKPHYKDEETKTESGVIILERPIICDENCDLYYNRVSGWEYEGGDDCIMEWDVEALHWQSRPGSKCPGEGYYKLVKVVKNDD